MTKNIFGKVLRVDLASGKVERSELDPEFARVFIGGMGFSNNVLYNEVGPAVDPLSPENLLIFAPGTFVGSHVPTAARTEITTKNPLTGSIGTGNTGGMWGAELKRAGFEMLIVENRADRPVYLQIEDDAVEIKEAAHLWGKDIYETARVLEGQSSSKFSVLAIGQAGENLVAYACPINDYHHGANRNGAGAVMGSKNLKAVIVRGRGSPNPARPEELEQAIKFVRERMRASSEAVTRPGSYTGGRDAVKRYLEEGGLRVKNYQSGFLPNFLQTRGREVAAKFVTGREGCYRCPTPCFDIGEVKEGKYAGTIVGRPTFAGIACAWGANCAIDNLPAIWKCKELTQRYGVDYVSASGVIAFAMELYQRGIITTSDTGGLELTWGNEDATIELLRQISYRQGFGAVLAEGAARAATIIGRGAEKFVMTLKNVEVMCGDPRAHQKLYVLCDMTNPRGGDNIKGGHNAVDPDKYDPNWWVDQFDMFPEMKNKIFKRPPQEIFSTWEGKAWMCKWTQDLYQLLNSVGICFPMGGRLLLGPDSLSRLYSAYTGWDTSPESMMRSGERIFNLFKSYCVRQGQSRKDDDWPDRFYDEPLADGPKKGQTLNRATMQKVLNEYYAARGWDKKTGRPTREKLTDLGLADIADDLAKHGKLP